MIFFVKFAINKHSLITYRNSISDVTNIGKAYKVPNFFSLQDRRIFRLGAYSAWPNVAHAYWVFPL